MQTQERLLENLNFARFQLIMATTKREASRAVKKIDKLERQITAQSSK